jgi:hypothetical protein
MKPYSKVTLIILWSVIIGFSSCTKSTNPEPSPTDARQQFLGNWGVNETVTKNYYTVTISADNNSANGVYIQNFGASTVQAFGIVNGNLITITSQTLANDWVVQGSGTFSNNKILWNYNITDGATSTNYIATFTKI